MNQPKRDSSLDDNIEKLVYNLMLNGCHHEGKRPFTGCRDCYEIMTAYRDGAIEQQLADLKAQLPSQYDLSGISDAYVEKPYELGYNQAIKEADSVIDAKIASLKGDK